MAKATKKRGDAPAPQGKLRNRVVERRRMYGAELAPNPTNWRVHTEAQSNALKGVLAEIGQMGELYAYHSERNGGKLTLVDGHLRAADFKDESWDVAITDLSDAEADTILIVYDPISAMAQGDVKNLEALVRAARVGDQDLATLIDTIAQDYGIVPPSVADAPPTNEFQSADPEEKLGCVCPSCGFAFDPKK